MRALSDWELQILGIAAAASMQVSRTALCHVQVSLDWLMKLDQGDVEIANDFIQSEIRRRSL